MDVKYRRVVLKISGEALAGEQGRGFDFEFITQVCQSVKTCAELGVELGIVIGGGNFWRGVKDGSGKVERVSADRMGMLATAMNCLAVADVLERQGARARLMTAVDIQGVGERYDTRRCLEAMAGGEVVLFACGTGHPFFSTDTAAALRAAEIGADAILLAKNVDGVYSADPRQDESARRYETISYEQVLERRLAVMDSTATSLAMDNDIPVLVFALAQPDNIRRVLLGESVGTLVYNEG